MAAIDLFELLIWELIIFTKFYHGKSGSVKIKCKGSCKKFVCSDALLFFRGRNQWTIFAIEEK